MLVTIKIQYHLTYRGLEGFAKSVLSKFFPELKLPTYSLICKRAAALASQLPKLTGRRPLIIMLDATGVKIPGEGEWKVRTHGKSKRRHRVKLHLAVDAKSQEIIALEVTPGNTADCRIGPDLIRKCPGSAKLYLADGAYDTDACRKAIKQKGGKALIPPRRNAKITPIPSGLQQQKPCNLRTAGVWFGPSRYTPLG